MNALCQYFESASLHEFEVAYDSQNMNDMKVIQFYYDIKNMNINYNFIRFMLMH